MQSVEEYGLTPEEYEERERQLLEPAQDDAPDWLAIAGDAYRTSDNYYSAGIRKQIEKNISLFNSKHPPGSKYHTSSYKYRSKIFRPKTRSSVRRHEAAAATAYFSTEDVVSCKAEDQNNDLAVFGAEVGKNLVNNRLREPKLLWFQTCIGAYQDAQVQGVVISRQDWKYKEKQAQPDVSVMASTEGEFEAEHTVLDDRPCIDLIPIENVRFDSASDWRDPVESSPYIIELIPMYRQDVIARMRNPNAKTGEPPWHLLNEDQLSTGDSTGALDTTRKTREQGRQDSKDKKHKTSAYDIVWIHRNIIRMDHEDYIYYTLGTVQMLSDPVLLEEVYPQGRPYVIGTCNIETHKVVPSAPVELTAGIQQEANDIANQRLDNVKLVINRRSFVKRDANIDTRNFLKSIPGGVTLVDDVDRDVRYDAPPDVTSSSYAEQDRLNNDFDELSGGFSGSSVASNRKLHETVGGMEIMNRDANAVTEYQLRVFAETWVKPVLHQFLSLEKHYEADPVRLREAANGLDPNIAIQALQQNMTVSLSVGFGATNPKEQVEKLAYGLNTVATFMPDKLQRLDGDAVLTEVFGALGYQDGKRFFAKEEDEEDPRIAQLTQQIQELQGAIQTRQAEGQMKLQLEDRKQQGMTERETAKNQLQYELAKINRNLEYIEKQIKAELNDIKRGDLIIQRDAFEVSRKEKELQYEIAERDKMSDIIMRDKYGMIPGVDDKPGTG